MGLDNAWLKGGKIVELDTERLCRSNTGPGFRGKVYADMFKRAVGGSGLYRDLSNEEVRRSAEKLKAFAEANPEDPDVESIKRLAHVFAAYGAHGARLVASF